jgi:hypothetical protein
VFRALLVMWLQRLARHGAAAVARDAIAG